VHDVYVLCAMAWRDAMQRSETRESHSMQYAYATGARPCMRREG
jgi:hypothetical protein